MKGRALGAAPLTRFLAAHSCFFPYIHPNKSKGPTKPSDFSMFFGKYHSCFFFLLKGKKGAHERSRCFAFVCGRIGGARLLTFQQRWNLSSLFDSCFLSFAQWWLDLQQEQCDFFGRTIAVLENVHLRLAVEIAAMRLCSRMMNLWDIVLCDTLLSSAWKGVWIELSSKTPSSWHIQKPPPEACCGTLATRRGRRISAGVDGLFRWMESFMHCTPWRICGMSWPTMMEHNNLNSWWQRCVSMKKREALQGRFVPRCGRRDYEVQKIETKWLLSY